MSKHLLTKWYNGHMLYRNICDPYYLTLLTNGYGSLIANALSGYSGSIIHLTATLLQSGDGNHQISTKEISLPSGGSSRAILFLPNANGNYKGSYYITGHRQTSYGIYENQNAQWGLTAIAP